MKNSYLIGAASVGITILLYLSDLRKIRQKQKQKEEKKNNKTINICLTGGPCGGKSEGIKCIYNTFKQIKAPFFIVPEAATIIGSSGLTLDLSNFESKQIELFQIYLMRLQYNLQEIINKVAKTLQTKDRVPVILCDRGLLDGKAYAGDENFARMLERIRITEEEICQRYEAVIHMETAARGAADKYKFVGKAEKKNPKKRLNTISQESDDDQSESGKQGHNKVRVEPPELAIELDKRIQKAYQSHSYRFILENTFFITDFETKKIILIAQVNQVLQAILQRSNLQEYYQSGASRRRKNNRKESVDSAEEEVPYLERKRKYQKFLRDRDRSRSPSPARA